MSVPGGELASAQGSRLSCKAQNVVLRSLPSDV